MRVIDFLGLVFFLGNISLLTLIVRYHRHIKKYWSDLQNSREATAPPLESQNQRS